MYGHLTWPAIGHTAEATSIGGVRGCDGAKKRSGRKRHLLVDVNGFVLRAVVQDQVASLLLHVTAPMMHVLEIVNSRRS